MFIYHIERGCIVLGKGEVVKRLKEHLQYCIKRHGKVKSTHKEYCIQYIMDFLFVGRVEAKKIYDCEVIGC